MNEILIANLTLDTTRKNSIPPLVVPQGDYGARVIRAKITDLGKPVIVESTAAVSIVATRSGDGESRAFSGRVNADGTVTVPVKQWMLDVPEEDVTCHIEATGIGYKYSTTSFLIEPQEKANPTEISEDDSRVDVVTEVLAGENTRRAAEAERVSNENARIAAENARQSAEEQRVTDESTRITNEAQRVSAEASRDATFKSWAQDIASLPTFDGRISANRKRIENLESGIPAESFILDDSVAYTKDVPENVAPNAVVQKVGGMTRKCANLLNLQNGTYKENGVTVTVNNQNISFSGRASDTTWMVVGSVTLNAGEYTFTCPQGAKNGCKVYLYHSSQHITLKDTNITVTGTKAFQVIIEVTDFTIDTSNFGTINLMLNAGSTALPYEPYFEGLCSAKVTEVKSVGANLFDFETWKATAATERAAVTYGDNSVTVSAIEGDAFIISEAAGVMVKGGETYTISFVESNTVIESVHYLFKNGKIDNSMKVFYGSPYTFVADADAEYYTVRFGVSNAGSTITFSNIKINKGSTALPYAPYTEHILPIPEAVQALPDYGERLNNSYQNVLNLDTSRYIRWVRRLLAGEKRLVNAQYSYENIVYYALNKGGTADYAKTAENILVSDFPIYTGQASWDSSERIGTVTGNADYGWYWFGFPKGTTLEEAQAIIDNSDILVTLATAEITDISDLITADNLIGVEGGGTLTFENEHKYAVPSTIIYQSL